MERFDPTDLRAFVAIQCLGLVEALKAGAIAPADAARWLFHADMLARLKTAGACEGCLGLVEIGTVLSEGDEAAIESALGELRRGAMMALSGCHEAPEA